MSIDWLPEKDRKALEHLHGLIDAISDPPGQELAEKDEVLRLRGHVAGLKLYLYCVSAVIIILSPRRQFTHKSLIYAAKQLRTVCRKHLTETNEGDAANKVHSGTMEFLEETIELLTNPDFVKLD